MADRIVGKVLVGHDGLKSLVKCLEVVSKEVGLNLREFIKLNQSIFKDNLVLLVESLGDHTSHQR